jgi:hypothetical protein
VLLLVEDVEDFSVVSLLPPHALMVEMAAAIINIFMSKDKTG